MDRVFIFDVDGTLTRAGRSIDPAFASFLMTFWPQEKVYLVTGSDYEKLKGQLPATILGSASGVFTCLGNELFHNGETEVLFRHDFSEELLTYSQKLIDLSPFCWRSGGHVSHRTGMLNISVVGRDADLAVRRKYIEFDELSRERCYLVDRINRTFPDYEATLGGQISINITPRGRNKAQVYRKLRREYPREKFHFFGDSLEPHGNDHPLAAELNAAGVGHQVHHVEDWHMTFEVLTDQYFPDVSAAISA